MDFPMEQLSPMMVHYLETKKQYQDCILFYRLGDFYEMFFDDAEMVSKELELTLTGKNCGLEERAPMCGIPFHAADTYIAKLVAEGEKVAICEQLEDPKEAKGIVKRGMTQIVSSGTVFNESLNEKENKLTVKGAKESGLTESYHFETKDELADYLIKIANPGDMVWIKASRGMRFEDIAEKFYED